MCRLKKGLFGLVMVIGLKVGRLVIGRQVVAKVIAFRHFLRIGLELEMAGAAVLLPSVLVKRVIDDRIGFLRVAAGHAVGLLWV